MKGNTSLLMTEEIYFLVTGIFSILISAIMLLIITMNYSRRKRETLAKTREVYRLVKENEDREKIDFVKKTTANIPGGLSENEFFSQMKKILSELSYSKLKNDEKNSKDKAIEELIRSHYEQALSQASVQFWSSLIASIIGFLFIILMILFANNEHWYEYILNVLPGSIIEAVSYLFFKQSSEIRNRASDFLNRLRNDEQISRSIVIADSINNEELKSLIKAKIALHICGINESNSLNKFFESNNNSDS